LNTPFLPIRKYHTVKLQLFTDRNGNGVMDGDEQAVVGQTLSLGEQMFVSNEKGIVELRNADKGTYKLDFGFTSKLRGWAPSNGVRQEVNVSGSNIFPVPYKVSRVLQGRLRLVLDSTSNLKFSLERIKVIAKDENGAEYSTITDEGGEFYLNVPAGNYTVSLSEAAFDENFRPVENALHADMVNNNVKDIQFEIRQKKRTMNIKKK
ncbi:MAG TPA: carboxypeptidase-like regulatory domain-containing protein, partial [Flavipsychrobacter sp.]|nr:carboxypeptidase-like regulatory domain-containing protein [Flavipsychrobacter sp.]